MSRPSQGIPGSGRIWFEITWSYTVSNILAFMRPRLYLGIEAIVAGASEVQVVTAMNRSGTLCPEELRAEREEHSAQMVADCGTAIRTKD